MKDRKRIARLVNVRQRLRDVKQTELAIVRRAVEAAEDRLHEAEHARDASWDDLTPKEPLSGESLQQRSELAERALRVVAGANETLDHVNVEHTEKQDEVREAHRDLRALQCLDGRLATNEAKRLHQREQHLTDEAAARGRRRP